MFSYPVDEAAKLRAEHKHLDTYYHYLTFSGTHTLANMDLDGNYRKPPLLPLRYLKQDFKKSMTTSLQLFVIHNCHSIRNFFAIP